MARSVWKGPFVKDSLIKKVKKAIDESSHAMIQTWERGSCIIPMFVGLTVAVHNGRKFVPVKITEDMVGHKLGEFAPTRTYNGHAADKKAKK